jgi:hypothetical protein
VRPGLGALSLRSEGGRRHRADDAMPGPRNARWAAALAAELVMALESPTNQLPTLARWRSTAAGERWPEPHRLCAPPPQMRDCEAVCQHREQNECLVEAIHEHRQPFAVSMYQSLPQRSANRSTIARSLLPAWVLTKVILRRKGRRIPDPGPIPNPDPIPVLTLLIEMTEVQLTEAWAEQRDQNTYALALAALGVATMGIVVSAQSALGVHWWIPIPGLAFASVIALIGTRGTKTILGPEAASFYAAYGATPAPEALAQLLADLIDVRSQVPATLRAQRVSLLIVGGLFAATAVYSTLLLA